MATTYQTSELNNLRDAAKDYLVLTVENDLPTLHFYDNTQSGPIKFATRISDGMPMYLMDLGNDTYEFLSFANVTNVGFYHVDPSFDTWLDTNGSYMFSGQNITLDNGTFTNYYVTKKPGYTYSLAGYKNFYPSLDQWTPPVINSYSSYLDGLSRYDFRLLSAEDSTWYTSDVSNGIKEYAVNGNDLPLTTPDPPVQGQIYTSADFSNLRAASEDVVLISVENDVPQLVFQDNTVDGQVKLVDVNDGTTGFVMDMGDGNYKYLADHQTSLGLVHIDKSMSAYLSTQYSHMFEGQAITLSTGSYTNVFVTCRPLLDQNTSEVMFLDENNSKFWGIPNTADISDYLNNIPAFDVKFYPDVESASWYTQLVQDAIRDTVLTFVPEQPPDPTDSTVVQPLDAANLIYTKSLYESSLAYFDSAISRIEQELAEEQNVANQLSSNDQQLLSDLQTFVNDKSQEINDKVTNLTELKTDLETLVQQNLQDIQSNEDLYNYLNTPEATDLTSKILELRDKVYDSLKFLTDNNRLGSNNDIVYIVNKVQI